LKNILVIGSRGFIGMRMVSMALSRKFNVHGVDVIEFQQHEYKYEKISIFSTDFTKLLSTFKYEFIINCAGSGNVGFSVEHPLSDYELNTRGVIYILDTIRLYQPECRYIHLSSAAVYGNPLDLVISENSSIEPISPYGYHKWQSELICKEYAYLFNLSTLVIRPFSVYGPGLRKQLLWDIFQKAKKNDVVELWGTGEETRDFIYVDDLCEIILKLVMLDLPKFEILNLAMGQSISISNIAELLISKLGFKNTIKFNNMVKPGDPRFWKTDVSKLTKYGLKTSVSLDKGINETAKWFLSNA
jgi:UDP-glucose 4-epimerase